MNEREERNIKEKKYEWFERETMGKVNDNKQFGKRVEFNEFKKLRSDISVN